MHIYHSLWSCQKPLITLPHSNNPNVTLKNWKYRTWLCQYGSQTTVKIRPFSSCVGHLKGFLTVCNFSYSMTSIISSQIYFIWWSSPMFIGVFFLNDFIKFKSNPIYFKQIKIIQNVMSILTLKNQMHKCNIYDYNFWGA